MNTERDVQSLIPPSIPITADISQVTFHSHLQALLSLLPVSHRVKLEFPLPPLAGQPLALLLPSLNLLSHQNTPGPPELPGKSGPCHTLPCTACPATSQKQGAEACKFTTSPSASTKHLPNLSAEGGIKLSPCCCRQVCLGLQTSAMRTLCRETKLLKCSAQRKAPNCDPEARCRVARIKGRLFSTSRLVFGQSGHSWASHSPLGQKVLEHPPRQTFPGVEALPLSSKSQCQGGLGHREVHVGT